jgi:hypothetical protein
MNKNRTNAKQEIKAVLKHLRTVDNFFSDLETDKNLPTFAEHVALCIILGTAEKVNLKKMYPKLCVKVSKMIQYHK